MDNKQLEHKKFLRSQSIRRSIEKRFNKLESKFKLIDAIEELKYSSRSTRNHFIFFPNNSNLHEDCKFSIFKILRRLNHDVYVEAEFKNGKRCDILDGSNCIIYEVLGSETDDCCDEKVKSYPEVFEVIKINAKNPDYNEVVQ